MRPHALATRIIWTKNDFNSVAAASASVVVIVIVVFVTTFVSRASDFNVCFHNLLIFIVWFKM